MLGVQHLMAIHLESIPLFLKLGVELSCFKFNSYCRRVIWVKGLLESRLIYSPGNKRELTLLYGEVGQGCDIRKFKKATKDKYSFFFVDAKTKVSQLMYRKNFHYVEM